MRFLFGVFSVLALAIPASATHVQQVVVRQRIVTPFVPVVQAQAVVAQPVVQAVTVDHCVQQVQAVQVAPVLAVQAFAFSPVHHVQAVAVQRVVQQRVQVQRVRSVTRTRTVVR